MHSLIQLSTNEWLKIVKKRSFIIMLVLILIGAVLGAWFIRAVIGQDFMSTGQFGSGMIGISGAGIVYFILCIVTASITVAQEHQAGTIKLLLIRAHQRTTILASKLMALLTYMVVMMVYFVAVSYLVGILFFQNVDGFLFNEALQNMAFTFIYTFAYVMLAFMFSTLLKSSAGTISIVLSISIFEGIFTGLLRNYDIAKYILFFHTDFSQYIGEGNVRIEGLTPTFSALVYAAYMIVFIIITFTVFKKRDVA